MNILNKKQIKKKDWNSFKKWSKEEFFLFEDTNFFSGFISINFNKIEENLIDFYIYNYFILEGRYFFDWPNWLKEIKGKEIKEFISNLFKLRFSNDYYLFKPLEKFLWNLREYKISNVKDNEMEYKLLKEYWEFIKNLRSIDEKNHNEWVIYINKRIHKKMKGFK